MTNEFVKNRQDASVNPAAKTLPNGAATVYTASIDLGTTNPKLANSPELDISAPALTNAQLGSGATMTYFLQDSADDSSFTTILGLSALTQTGAGAGAVAIANKRVAIPSGCRRYVRVAVTNSAAGNASAASVTVKAMF
jgi:hypothetical protein